MYHTVEFVRELLVDLETSPRHSLKRSLVRSGSRLRAQVKPYVVETGEGPAEMADLFFEDGTATRAVPFACFAFADG